MAKIAERAATIKTGDGTGDADMGPASHQGASDKVALLMSTLPKTDGATIVLTAAGCRIRRRWTASAGPDPARQRHHRHVLPLRRNLALRVGGPVDTYEEAIT